MTFHRPIGPRALGVPVPVQGGGMGMVLGYSPSICHYYHKYAVLSTKLWYYDTTVGPMGHTGPMGPLAPQGQDGYVPMV